MPYFSNRYHSREPLTLFEAINGLSTSAVQRPTTQAPNKSFAIARCDAHGDVVTTATGSTSDPLGGNSPLKAINQKAVVVKKRITKSDLDTEHIELDEIDTRAREASVFNILQNRQNILFRFRTLASFIIRQAAAP
jgi:hypothetical protein